MSSFPAYLELLQTGELGRRVQEALAVLEHCEVCPRTCGVNRREGEPGYCGSGYLPEVSSYFPHFGEERPLVGLYGSGTIFFSRCNMRCVYCQNADISQCGHGREVSFDDLARMMLSLQVRGCHNINVVSPSHVIPQILAAVAIAARKGLAIPLVYNSGGYDAVPMLRLLDGVVDIYMPDAKYADKDVALRYSDAPDYPAVMKTALKEMHRQVGDLITEGGIARRGMIIRHLVLPHNLAGTDQVMRFIAEEISKDSYVNVMDQYRPQWRVLTEDNPDFRPLKRPITGEEYLHALDSAKRYGLHRFA